MNRRIFFAVLWLSFFAASVSADDLPEWSKVDDSEWALQSVTDYPDANAVVLFDIGRLEVETSGISFYRHVRIKILNDAGAEEAGDVKFWYWDGDKIKDLKAQTITPDGKKHEVEGGNIKEQEFGERRTKTFAFPNIVSGSILEYRYRNFNKRFTYLDSWRFHNDQYTKFSRIDLDLAAGFVYSTAFNNVPAPNRVAVEEFDKRTMVKTFIWKMENIPPLRDEPYQGALYNYLSAIRFQIIRYEDEWNVQNFISGWPDLGKQFSDNFLKDFTKRDKGLDELANRITSGAANTEEKARAVYRWVRDSIRTEPNETRYFPREKIEQLPIDRVGTSDEKNVLIVELCKRLGIDAWSTLITTRDRGIFNYEIYQLQQFNHVIAIVQVGEGGYLLDASNTYCPFGVLPPNCLVKGGFLIDGENSRVITINANPPQSTRTDEIHVSINDSGQVQCSTHTVLTGYFTVYYGKQLEKRDPEEFVNEIVLADLDAEYDLVSHDVNIDVDQLKLESSITYTSDELMETLDGNLFLGQPNLTFSANPFVDDKRFFPIDFTFPAFYHTVITYDIDTSYSVSEMPEKREMVAASLEFQRQSWLKEDKVTVESKFLIGEALIAPYSYFKVRDLFKEMETSNREQIVFVPKNAE